MEKNIMTNFLKILLIPTILAVLLVFSTSSSAGETSHVRINDAYDAAYTTGGIIIMSDDKNYTTLTTLQLPYEPIKLCDTFGSMVDVIIFTKDDYTTVYLDCAL